MLASLLLRIRQTTVNYVNITQVRLIMKRINQTSHRALIRRHVTLELSQRNTGTELSKKCDFCFMTG